jgi:hypothetical protein
MTFKTRADLKSAYDRKVITPCEYKKYLAWIVLEERRKAQEGETGHRAPVEGVVPRHS